MAACPNRFLLIGSLLATAVSLPAAAPAADFELKVEQITSGPKHHFFGYIGHAKNIPWNGNGRYIVALETTFQDRMPTAKDAANVILIDTHRNNAITVIDQSRAWNFQQGTMFYWNPKSPDTQLFFNDRDPRTNQVFAVLYDIEKKRRVREFRYEDTPFGNSGVAQNGGWFLGLNYGRLARLRPVTGYPESFDWTTGVTAPDNDGIFLVEVATGKKKLLVSYKQMLAVVEPLVPKAKGLELFVNHTLWNREDNRIWFYVRGDYLTSGKTVNVPCSIRVDGTGLTAHTTFIGGHPEWEQGSRIIGAIDEQMVIYDVDQKKLVGAIGNKTTFPKASGDTALSPDYRWIVNGSRGKEGNIYTALRLGDGATARTRGFPSPGLEDGDLRVDGSPCWNRTNDGFLFPAIANDAGHTRQLFVTRIVPVGKTGEKKGKRSAGVTFATLSPDGVFPTYTVKAGIQSPPIPGDQSNTFSPGDKLLRLSNKGLTSLEGISKLRLNVDGKVMPIAEVDNLHLFFNQNEIRELPDELFTLQNVAWIYLYYNRLEEVPPGIAQMKGLQGIYLTGNYLTRLPAEIFTMTQMRKFQASQNRLTEVPEAIGNLTMLAHLNLAGNAIEVLPDSISKLKRLRVCDFSHNRIRTLPESFGGVPIYHQLRITNNPLISLPQGFEALPGSIDITETYIDIEKLSPALRSKISREKRNTKPVKPKK